VFYPLRATILFFSLILFDIPPALPQSSFFTTSDTCNPTRVKWLAYGTAGIYTAGMTGLYQVWYKDYDLIHFHFFDDYDEWYQHDKLGHIGSSYYLSRWGMGLYRWTGMSRKKAIWIGGTVGLGFMTTIEIFDGFSAEWGFSVTDVAANTLGTAMAISQQLMWDEQRVTFKFSFLPSDYSQYRPDLFGTTFPEKLVKDYNGQTVWLSANIKSFLSNKESWIPAWLNVAAGYGMDGLTGARFNPESYNGKPIPPFERYRQFYLAPDIDFSKIKTRKKGLKFLFSVLGFIKIPAPALEFNRVNKIKLHALYF
jgi:uncharacterized protein YfiM (DUF2279 family)